MKTIVQRLAITGALVIGVTAGAGPAWAQNAAAVQPDATAVLAANSTAPSAAPAAAPSNAPVKVAAAAATAAPPPAPAPAGTPTFAEDFSFADSAWSLVDAHIGDGLMTHTPKPDHWSNAFYYGALFKDADVRVDEAPG